MGHWDWHLHEYVQDNGCGFSILMDENFSRARIKEQLRRILATDRATLERISRNNRRLWERSHDVTVMAHASRRAVGLETRPVSAAAVSERRGALWLGDPSDGGWVPLAKLKTIARRLVDVFDHDGVDLIGNGIGAHPELQAVATYCRDIGLTTAAVLDPRSAGSDQQGREPAGTRWSLADAQRRADRSMTEPENVFGQVLALRVGASPGAITASQRVINQLTIRVSESASDRPVVWFYGSALVGLEIINAIRAHRWLSGAVDIGGFVSSPGQCKSNVPHGYAWRSADGLLSARADFIVVASETSRLSIQEELSRLDLLDRMLPAFGMAADSAVYEREPDGPGQAFVAGSSARDYATRELVARGSSQAAAADAPTRSGDEAIQAAA
jgi:hypothetical protein